MVATPITASTRFFHRGLTKVYNVPTIAASTLIPTRAELNAGTDLSNEVSDWAGWLVKSSMIDTPDLGHSYRAKIPGETSSDDSSITFYASKDGIDVRALLPRGTNSFIAILDGGDVTAYKMDVFPVRVSSAGKTRSLGNDAGMVVIEFAITSQPAENVAVPA
jgi:hypothetical protein